MIKRCSWVEGKEEIYIRYHDDEWGIAKYDDDILFEMLVLESFQAGLSWITMDYYIEKEKIIQNSI